MGKHLVWVLAADVRAMSRVFDVACIYRSSVTPENERTLDLARVELNERLKRQAEEIKALDLKAQILLGFAITALTLILNSSTIPAVFVWVSGLCFLPAIGFGAAALSVTPYWDPIVAKSYVKDLDKGYYGLLLDAVLNYRNAVVLNEAILDDRAKKWKAALVSLALAVGIGVLGLAIGVPAMAEDKDKAAEAAQEQRPLSQQVENAEAKLQMVQKDKFGGKSDPEAEMRRLRDN